MNKRQRKKLWHKNEKILQNLEDLAQKVINQANEGVIGLGTIKLTVKNGRMT